MGIRNLNREQYYERIEKLYNYPDVKKYVLRRNDWSGLMMLFGELTGAIVSFFMWVKSEIIGHLRVRYNTFLK